ncbi:MAG TPA: YfiR family protein [Chthonomonadales bacterium]|nr:YfiR family protein [Chthonomonadales bacterium]
MKAAFTVNFVRFVEWPAGAFASASSPIVVGVVGRDPYGPVLDRVLAGQRVGGRSFVTRRLRWDQDLSACHVLLVPGSERSRLGALRTAIKGAPVLTVGETPGFAQRHGIVNFVVEQSHVRFEINVDEARRARLTFSSKLLALARVVEDAR